MLTGFKGVKYGLQKNPKAAQAGASKPRAQLAAFAQGDSSDEEDNVNVQLKRQQAHKAKQAKWEQQHAAALEQDASVFDYDGVYDSIKTAREKPKQAEKAARKSRYIESMLEKTKERNKEQDILYERQLARERKVEDAVYGDKEKFVTAAYKRKLEEDQKWLEEEKRKELIEEQNDVTKREGLGDFYRNLHRNAAFGGSRFAAVHASKEQRSAEEQIVKGEGAAKKQEREGEEGEGSAGGVSIEQRRQPASDKDEGPPAAAEPSQQPAPDQQPAQEEPQEAAVKPAAAAATAGKRRNTEDAVAAARQRYLERKRAKG